MCPQEFDRDLNNGFILIFRSIKCYLSPRCRGLSVGLQIRPPASTVILRLSPPNPHLVDKVKDYTYTG